MVALRSQSTEGPEFVIQSLPPALERQSMISDFSLLLDFREWQYEFSPACFCSMPGVPKKAGQGRVHSVGESDGAR